MRTRLFARICLVVLILPSIGSAQISASPGSSGSGTVCPSITRTLSRGSRGNDVTQLQQYLISQSLLAAGSATGYFGALTQRAVQLWQTKQGIVSSGTPLTTGYGLVGVRTRNALRNCAGSGAVSTQSTSQPVSTSGPCEQAGPGCGVAGQTVQLPLYCGYLCNDPSGICSLRQPQERSFTSMDALKSYGATFLHAGACVCGDKGVVACDSAQVPNKYANVQSNSNVVDAMPSPICTFNGAVIQNGSYVSAYQSESVPYGSTCQYQTRFCANGVLTGTYQYSSCVTSSAVTPVPAPSPAPPAKPPVTSPSPVPLTPSPNPSQSVSIDGPNIYSPAPVLFGSQPRLYFGGWTQAGQTHDNIYVADCPFASGACSNIRTIIDSVAKGFEHLNDPTIVTIPASGGNPAYYLMYMTCVFAGENGLELASNRIYYSTSWATDGVTWSSPALLMNGFWLPSATVKDGHVELFANSTSDGRVAKFDLGTSGTSPSSPVYVSFDNSTSFPAYYSNVDVVWRPALGIYQMVAERMLSAVSDASSVIDFLTSNNGQSWHLANPSIISPVSGQHRVGTPAQWTDSAQWVYFSSTSQTNSMGFKIRFAQWTP